MPLARKRELLDFLSEIDAFPKKRLSQNFLVDKNILDKIIKEANLSADDCVLEIGSGPGALTEALLETKAKVIAVEKDPVLAEKLKRFGSLEIFSGDIRDFPLEKLCKKTKVVSNLPYHLTASILSLLLPRRDLFSELILMVQREVAERMVAVRGENFSSFSVFVQFYSECKIAFNVSANCFYPVPKVTSSVVKLKLKARDLSFSEERFFITCKKAFQMRRKQLAGSLKGLFKKEKIMAALEEINRNPKSRPEDLSCEEWIHFFIKLLRG